MKLWSRYIYQLGEWPNFTWSSDALLQPLVDVRSKQSLLKGYLEAMGFTERNETTLTTLTLDVLKSTEIEGEILNKEQVRSSVAKQLGMDIAGLIPTDRHVDGVVEMMLDATQNYELPLTKDRMFGWHTALFPTGRSGMRKIIVGNWRTDKAGPMQVVSGNFGREKVHYEAPPASVLEKEMNRFFKWFNGRQQLDPVLKAAIAHLWFITLHPFADGNGRIARAISDMQLTRAEADRRRFYSMSAQIRIQRNGYYDILEKTQKGSLDITPWIKWFLDCMESSLNQTETRVKRIVQKAHFWDKHSGLEINERQRLMLNKLLDGFDGNLTSSKWATIAKCSADTAVNDIKALVEKGILKKGPGGGRSTNYGLG